MREFRNPVKLFSKIFAVSPLRTRGARALAEAISVTKDGDEPRAKPKKTRGISSQRATLLTAGTAVGQETKRRSLLGVS